MGLLHLGMAFLLAPHWRGNGMAVSVTCSQMLVTAAEFYYPARRQLLPSLQFQHEVANV